MKSVIFDMDGVLIDSEPLHQQTELAALAEYGLKLKVEDLHPYIGTTRQAFQDGLSERYDFHPDWKALFDHKDRHFYELLKNVDAMPGVLDLIRSIKQEGMRMALATSGQKHSVEIVLDRFSDALQFDAVVCASDVTKSKPDPEVFLLAAERLQSDPSDCAVFEDAINGVRAANAAGMYSIGITTSFSREALHEADRTIDRYSEIQAADLKNL